MVLKLCSECKKDRDRVDARAVSVLARLTIEFSLRTSVQEAGRLLSVSVTSQLNLH